MPRLVIEKGVDKGREVLVTPALSVTVGREVTIAPGNIRLTDTMVSRTQFRIVHKDGAFHLIDEDSRNGTFLNGQRVKDAKLEIGAKIDAGETMFSFLADAEETKRGGRVGQMIGGYRIVERVGRGGMGTVYKALQLSLNRVVALKLLADELVRDQSFINLFIQEARAAAQLNHPNIAQVYDVNRVPERDAYIYYFSMEYLPNGSVQDHLAKEKKLTPKRATRIVLDAAKGLEYAEKKKIVHRDIKPDNLMIGEEGVVKICDLGLAKKLDPTINVKDEREQGCVFGTPHYVAPEQALGKPADHRSDIYSLGSTFYRLLAGQTPYQGASAREIVIAKVKTEPIPIPDLDPTVPANLVTIVEKMMCKDPDQRYQSASEVVLALEAMKSELDGGPTTLTSFPSTGTAPMDPPPLAQRVLVPMFMFIVMGSLGAAGYFGYKHFFPDPKHDGGNPTPGVGPTPGPPDTAKEKLAAKQFSDAETWERAVMNGALAPSLKEAIQKYEEVKSLTHGMKYEAMAQEAIDRLRKKLTALGAQESLRALQASAKQIDELLASRETRKTVEDRLKSLRDDVQKKFEAIKKDYEGSEAEKAGRKLLEAADNAAKGFAAAAEAYDKAVGDAETSKGQGRFGAAIKCLTDFQWTLEKGSWFERQVGDDIAVLRTESDTAWDHDVAQPIATKLAAGKFAEARELLKTRVDLFDLPQLREAAKGIGEKIDAEERLRNESAFKAKRDADIVLWEAAYVRSLPDAVQEKDYRYDLAWKAMNATRGKIQTDEIGKAFDGQLDLIARIGALKAALIDRINGRNGLSMKKRSAYLQRHGQSVEFQAGGADETGVLAELANPKGTIKADWSSWGPKKLRAIFTAGWDLSAEDRLALGLFDIMATVHRDPSSREQDLMNEAREDLEAARALSDGGNNPQVWAVAGAWLERLDDIRANGREQAAQVCLRVGARSMRDQAWPDAVTAYEYLSTRLGNTEAYRATADEVKSRLAEARQNAQK